MAGGTPEHNVIAGNLLFALKTGLRHQPYAVFVADQRLAIPAANIFTYPDVMVVGKPFQLFADRKDTVANPVLIAEVLSDSTKNYDRGDKFLAYRTLPSLQEYLLINQYRMQAEHYVKQNDSQWLLTEYEGEQATFRLASLPIEISLLALYEGIEFSPAS